tara:strand:- start:40 stop:279 length:240 start_codon:yes stop_codon:yes gene_type:complete
MPTKTTLETQIHINAEWNNSRIIRTIQVPTYVMDRIKVQELESAAGFLPRKNDYPAQENFDHRALTWFEIEQIEDITLT